MPESFTVVFCRLTDCTFYAPEPSDPAKCRCSHAEKHIHLKELSCPLYRADWRKRLEATTMPTRKRSKKDF